MFKVQEIKPDYYAFIAATADDIPFNTLIHEEDSLIQWDISRESEEDVYERIPLEISSKIMELHDNYTTPLDYNNSKKEWTLQKFKNIIKTNAHYDYSKSIAYLFPIASRMNHSCKPNTVFTILSSSSSSSSSGGRIVFKSVITSSIKKNEEITCSYLSIDELLYNRNDRRKALKERFECNCTRCSKEEDDVITNTSIEIPFISKSIKSIKSMMKNDVEDCLKFYTDLSEYEGVNSVTKGYIVLYGTDSGIPPLCDLLQFRDRISGLEEKIEDLIRRQFRRTVKDFYRVFFFSFSQSQSQPLQLQREENNNKKLLKEDLFYISTLR
jgi:hypothetical protein